MFKVIFEEKNISLKEITRYFERKLSEDDVNYKYEDNHFAIIIEKDTPLGNEVRDFIKNHFHHMRSKEFMEKIQRIFINNIFEYITVKDFEQLLKEHWNRAFSQGYEKHKEELRKLIF